MKTIIIINLTLFLILSSFSPNKSKIDEVKGFHKYKFEMTLNDCNCNKGNLNKYDECLKYPSNLFVDSIKVEKISLNFQNKKLNRIHAYVGFKFMNLISVQSMLTKKYGKPKIIYKIDLQTNKKTNQIALYCWEGEEVKISLHPGNQNLSLKYITQHYVTFLSKGKRESTEF